MIKVYGCSDDLVEIENSEYLEDEIGCFNADVIITFTDETKIKCHYGKPNFGVWSIEVLNKGTSTQFLTECFDEDTNPYSDVFEIDAEVVSHQIVY